MFEREFTVACDALFSMGKNSVDRNNKINKRFDRMVKYVSDAKRLEGMDNHHILLIGMRFNERTKRYSAHVAANNIEDNVLFRCVLGDKYSLSHLRFACDESTVPRSFDQYIMKSALSHETTSTPSQVQASPSSNKQSRNSLSMSSCDLVSVEPTPSQQETNEEATIEHSLRIFFQDHESVHVRCVARASFEVLLDDHVCDDMRQKKIVKDSDGRPYIVWPFKTKPIPVHENLARGPGEPRLIAMLHMNEALLIHHLSICGHLLNVLDEQALHLSPV